MNKGVLILSDALRYDVAKDNMGFLGHLVESKLASLYKVIGELPSMSRPMYETIHTGLPSSEHGIVANSMVRSAVEPANMGLAYGLTEAMISIATILAPVLAGLLYAKNPVSIYAVSFFLILISIIAGAVFSPRIQSRAVREKGALVKLS